MSWHNKHHLIMTEIIMRLQCCIIKMPNIPIWDNALCNLTDEDEEQDEGEEPSQVVSRKVKPGAVVDVDLWTLAAPTSNMNQEMKVIEKQQGHFTLNTKRPKKNHFTHSRRQRLYQMFKLRKHVTLNPVYIFQHWWCLCRCPSYQLHTL